jgi:hypothetical protein
LGDFFGYFGELATMKNEELNEYSINADPDPKH